VTHATGQCTAPDGVTISYIADGSGTPVALVPGWSHPVTLGHVGAPLQELVTAAARWGRLIRYDLRGHGRSDHAAGDLTLGALVSDLEAVLDALSIERCQLIGISDGCATAIEYAARHPDRVERLVLIGSSLRGRPEVAAAVGAIEYDVATRLADVRSETLVIHSRFDPVAPYEHAVAIAEGIPAARLLALASHHHLVPDHDAAWDQLRGELWEFFDPGRRDSPSPDGERSDDLSSFLVTGGAARGSLFSGLAAELGDGNDPRPAPTDPGDDPLIGISIGRYRVTDRLGVGGMGVVYRAVDTKLSRPVAIKLLPLDRAGDTRALERFELEARAVSALNHPNICVLHEIGEHEGRPFLVLELLEGDSLDHVLEGGAIRPARALEIAAAVADGLEAAHEAGILHRDVKPANLFITRRGHVKILDFGIAKLMPKPPETDATLATEAQELSLTRPGTAVGTFAFMSPEQIRDQDLDGRTDVFSLGAVLYEMLSGRRAFSGTTAGAIIDSILHDDPPPLTDAGLDSRLQRVVQRALSKDRGQRWSNAGDLRDQLEALRLELISGSQTDPTLHAEGRSRRLLRRIVAAAGAVLVGAAAVLLLMERRDAAGPPVAAAAGTTAVAVLPFEDLSPDPVDRYLALSVPDEVTNVLARAHELAVRPFSETRRIDPATESPREIADELGADHLVTGQLYQSGGELRLTLEAIDSAAERVVWRETVSLPADDLTAMRRELSTRVRSGLLPALGVSSFGEAGSTPASSEAYRLYLEALPMLNDPQPNAAATARLERSVELDPGFAPAWSELGKRRFIDAFYWGGGDHQRELARTAVARALELDPDLLDAAGTFIDLRVADGAVIEAYTVARGIVDHRPQSAYAHSLLAVVLRYAGLLDEAVAACERGFELDRRDPRLRSCTWPYLWSGEYERAAEYASRASSLLWQNDVMARIALMEGRDEEARRLWSRQVDPSAGQLRRDAMVACLDGNLGAETALRFGEDFDRVLAIHDPEWTFASAGLFARCGYHELGLDLLRRAADGGYCVDPSPEVDPLLSPLATTAEISEIRRITEQCRDRVRRAMTTPDGEAR
jgi:pimeloyl-ACP methyl ester carboxylesterase/TolB-like protein/Flp pilus assembly protein TadD